MKLTKLLVVFWVLFLINGLAEAVEVKPNLQSKRICLSPNFALIGIHSEAAYAKQLSYDEDLKTVSMADSKEAARLQEVNPLSSDSVIRMEETSQKIRRWLLTGKGANTLNWDNFHTASHLMAVINNKNADRILQLIDENTTLLPMQVGIAISYGASIDLIEALLIRTSNYTNPWFDQLAGHEHTLLTVAIDSNNRDVFNYLRERFGGMTNFEIDILRLQVFKELSSENANETRQFLNSLDLIDVLDTAENKANNTHFIDVAEALVNERDILINKWKHLVIAENPHCKKNTQYLSHATLIELKGNNLIELDDIVSFLEDDGINIEYVSSFSRIYFELANLRKEVHKFVSEETTSKLYSFFDLIESGDWATVKRKYNDLNSGGAQLKSSVLATIALADFPGDELDDLFNEKIKEDSDFLFTLYELGALDLILRVTKSSKLTIIYDSNFKSSLYHFLNGGGERKNVENFNLIKPHKDNKGITYLNLIAGKD
ncbi:MAG: hypothetical protein JXQ95_06415 [Alteromonas stellipolaris]|uniref:hypothetical protein n=1 Tax=Alteromonas stellipolaris TaxID=233316 RepID=UPI003B8E2CAC